MLPRAQVAHVTDNRLRIRIPSMKSKLWYFEKLTENLSARGDVKEVWTNPSVGSVLIIHEARLEDLVNYASNSGLFSLSAVGPTPKTLYDEVAGVFKGWNRNLKSFTGGRVDIPSLVFLLLIISGVYQIMRGRFTAPAWYTAFWYALGVFSKGQIEDWDAEDDMGGSIMNGPDLIGDGGE